MKKILLSFLLAGIMVVVQAQSYHFSQFFSTPLLTNPAQTGFTEGPYRFASNMRSQGSQGNTFFTGYVSADLSLLRNSLPIGHKAGLGVYMMNDKSLTSALSTNTVGFSAAYNVGLDAYGEQSIGAGLQATYSQRRIDYSKLTFENQYGPGGFDGSLPIGEPLDVNSKQFFDVNAGILYNRIRANHAYFAGLSVYNILQHKENLLEPEYAMPLRYTLQAGAQFSFPNKAKLYTSFTTMRQAGANQITLGAAGGFSFSEEQRNELIGGLWYRFGDAFIPYVGYQYTGFQLGLSYDHTVSTIKAGQIKNAYELTLIYKAPDKRELKTHIPWF